LATPQEVLQADWQEVWHCPQPPFSELSESILVLIVIILSIKRNTPFKNLWVNELLVRNYPDKTITKADVCQDLYLTYTYPAHTISAEVAGRKRD